MSRQKTTAKINKGYESFYQLYIKRIIDVFICLTALPFVIVVMLPFAVAIKLSDGGPVFYRSRRLGLNFKEFRMLKLRSMKVNSPDLRNADGNTYSSKNDPRVTKIGRILRETSLDEIPQIFNVLAGQMSLVGPRPGDVESKDTYEKDEKDKLLIRPGITGYTQAYFRNGMGVRQRRLCDVWYVHNVNFILDVKVFVRTVKTVLMRENIYKNK